MSPLLILQGLAETTKHLWLGISLVAGGATLLLVPLLLFVAARSIHPTEVRLDETRLSTPDLAAFLLAYLLPILAFDLFQPSDAFALGFLVLIMAVVYTRGGLIHVQPAFFLFGWHVYESKKSSGEWCWVISKDTLIPGTIKARALGGHVLVRARRDR